MRAYVTVFLRRRRLRRDLVARPDQHRRAGFGRRTTAGPPPTLHDVRHRRRAGAPTSAPRSPRRRRARRPRLPARLRADAPATRPGRGGHRDGHGVPEPRDPAGASRCVRPSRSRRPAGSPPRACSSGPRATSALRDGDRVAVTGTGVVLGDCAADHVTRRRPRRPVVAGGWCRPPSSTSTSACTPHLDVTAVVHTHAPWSTAVACVLDELPGPALPTAARSAARSGWRRTPPSARPSWPPHVRDALEGRTPR